jgi:alkyl sulfatase BDS1-like metallo-beta-lactamase superfamily hydrolase
MLFDYLAVRLNAEKAAGKKFSINIDFTDLKSNYTLTVENSVLNHTQKQLKKSDVTLALSMKTMNSIQLGEKTFDQAIKNGDIKLKGNKKIFDNFMPMLDDFKFWFNIVTP